MDPLFEVHMLNDAGKVKARQIAEAFDGILAELAQICPPEGRYTALVRTHLEEACFYAKKSMAMQRENQEGPQAASA